MKKQKITNMSIILSLVVALAGCSAFRPYTQTLHVTCTPNNAVIIVDGEKYSSPAHVRRARDRSVTVQCFKKGYLPYHKTIGSNLNTTAVLDIIGTIFFYFPAVGLFFPGARSLDTTRLDIDLIEDNSEASLEKLPIRN